MQGVLFRAGLVATSLAILAGVASARPVGSIGLGPTRPGIGGPTLTPGAVPSSRAQLVNPVCQTALDPLARGMEITAVMRPLASKERLAIEFVLGRRRGKAGRFRPVPAQHLSHWITPSPATLGANAADRWKLTGQAVKLFAPAYYRFDVKFRWSDPHGAVLARATRVGPVCFQPELRPDLLVSSINAIPRSGGTAAYVARVRNRGLTAAGSFSVELALGGSVVDTQTLAMLRPRSTRRVHFLAAACTAGEPVSVIVDPTLQVDEYDFLNNTTTISCPLSSSPPPPGGLPG